MVYVVVGVCVVVCVPGYVVFPHHGLGGGGVATTGDGRQGLAQVAGGSDMVLHVLRIG